MNSHNFKSEKTAGTFNVNQNQMCPKKRARLPVLV